jgi:hypothetical protein
VVPIAVQKLPEGESGIQKGNLTENRIEALAEYWGTPEKQRKYTPDKVAEFLGVSVATVRRSKTDKRIKAAVKEALDSQLLYDVVEARAIVTKIMHDEKERGDTRLKAARTVEQLAGNLSGNAPQISITNDFSSYGELPDDEIMRLGRRIFGDDSESPGS